ncbi:MAG: hypothetical protein NC191_08040 [Muribaculaceae bacterium]|nr:hypothetical protein [Muribaculaceae bacterium]
MRISGINFYSINNYFQKPVSSPALVLPQKALGVQGCDTVSFSGHRHAPNSAELKELLPYGIPDIYSGVILIDSREVEAMMSQKVFEQPIKKIVRDIKKHEQSMFPVEQQIYHLMRKAAKETPQMKLDEFIQSLVPEHSKKLLNIQRPIFNKLNKLAKGMPADLYEQYQYLIYQTNKKLDNEPLYQPFSLKEFRYKLGRIKERIEKSKDKRAKLAIEKLYEMTEFPEVKKGLRLSKGFPRQQFEEKQKNILLKVSRAFEDSVLSDDVDLRKLIETSRARMYKIPTNIKFNRKGFIHDLKEITDQLEDEKLARKMIQTAVKLPTSKQNISAFVMKSANRSSGQIGYDLFSGAIGSADHLVAQHKGGKSDLSNYVLSSGYMNSEKAHERFSIMLRKNPMIRVYAQRQMDRLIELANAGVFKEVGLSKNYIYDLARNLKKLSAPQPPLILDTSALK